MKKVENTITKIQKRDGRKVPFDSERITNAIFKAAQAVGGKNREIAKRLSDEVVSILENKFVDKIPSVEDIQDIVERTLIENGHTRVAKAYIIYRRQHEEIRKLRSTQMEIERVIEDYLGGMDWRVQENANIPKSLSGLMFHISNRGISGYVLSRVYPPEIADAHIHGDLHIHDLGMGIAGYCAGWSLQDLLLRGFGGVSGKVSSSPPRHLDTALLQMVNFIGSLQNEWAGAQAFNSIDTLLAPFVKKDELGYRQVKQAIQKFVYNLNIASRWGGQTPFTNVTLDLTPPEDLAGQPVIIGGKPQDITYSDFTEEMNMINLAFIDVIQTGDSKGTPFTFPIPTYNLTKDSCIWDGELSEKLFKMTAKYGLPYFQNFINSDLNPDDVRSMCCHLRLDLKELKRNVTGGLFGSGDKTGSLGVVTINMPRLGYKAKDENQFFEKLESVMFLAKQSLEIKRKLVEKNIDNNLLPFSKVYLGSINNHFSTIGLVGMNEACLNLINEGIESESGRKFALKVLKFMLLKIKDYQHETGNLYNLEATPAEGTAYRLAKIDKKKYPNIITAGKEVPYYTNSTQLPANSNLNLNVVEALRHQEEIQSLYTGGTVWHAFLGEAVSSWEGCCALTKKVATNFKVPYFTITPTYSICPAHGYISGEHFKCPICNKVSEVYSRIVGYYRPVSNWNIGKQEEFKDRKYVGMGK